MIRSPNNESRRNAPLGAFRRFVVPGALFAAVVAAFARTLGAGAIWDDVYLTVRNPNLATWVGVRRLVSTDIWSSSALGERSGYYRPVASLTFALNRLVAGNSAAAYHAGNVLMHALVVVLLLRFVLVRRIATLPRALACVFVFATMPLVAEPVSWIAGRYDVLGALFALLAFEANARAARAWTTPIAFALAVLTKEPYAALPALVFLDDALVFRRSALREWPKYGALVAVLACTFALRAWTRVPEPTRLLAQGGVGELARAYAFAWETFGALAVWPSDLCFFHTYEPPSGFATVVTLAIVTAAVASAFAWWRRAPWTTARGGVLLGVAWCVLAMAPGALTAPTLRIIGDRYAYFSLAGGAVALAGVTESVLRGSARVLAPFVLGVLGVAQTVRLESRLGELQSEDTMFRATLARDPDNFTTLSLYGTLLAQRGEYARAEDMLLHARRVAPMTGDIDAALSFVHLHERRFAEAEADGRRAVAGKPENPRAWLNLASALVDEGKAAPAAVAATRALAVRPRFAEAHYVRALARVQLGRVDDAHDDLVAALAIDPSHAAARAMLARFRVRSGP